MECTICNKYFCTTSYGCTVCTSDLKVMLSFGFTRDDLIMINKGLVVPHNIIEKLLLNVNILCEGSTIFKYLLNPDIRELDDIKCKICNKHVNFTKNDEYGKIEIYTGVSEYCAIKVCGFLII